MYNKNDLRRRGERERERRTVVFDEGDGWKKRNVSDDSDNEEEEKNALLLKSTRTTTTTTFKVEAKSGVIGTMRTTSTRPTTPSRCFSDGKCGDEDSPTTLDSSARSRAETKSARDANEREEKDDDDSARRRRNDGRRWKKKKEKKTKTKKTKTSKRK